ncbi:hypothetical protein RND81_10G046700 [Saponaria officinalis]|uniref:Helitron helicase-like domain-containing protein n=1 Tax=Saponaria officinalis TaxID=3572 RepID=A0AAW1HYP0_SAPOF
MPSSLRQLFISNDDTAKNFRQYVMLYNSTFAFTSLGVKKDNELAHRNRGIYTFRVQGQMYHFINDILPTQERPRYIQLYFYDTDLELAERSQISSEMHLNALRLLMRVMENNPYARFFRSLRNLGVQEWNRIVIRANPTHDQRTYNAPTASQVAGIWVEDAPADSPLTQDILVYARSRTSHRIFHYYGCYDPLQYPILFPYGETGWHRCIYRRNVRRRPNQHVESFPINEVLVQTVDDLLYSEEQGLYLFFSIIFM